MLTVIIVSLKKNFVIKKLKNNITAVQFVDNVMQTQEEAHSIDAVYTTCLLPKQCFNAEQLVHRFTNFERKTWIKAETRQLIKEVPYNKPT